MSAQVWNFPDEKPGTLQEIFASKDSRAQNLVLYEISKVDSFRKCWEAVGAQGDAYQLILAVMVYIAVHLKPEHRISHRRRELLGIIRNLTETATKLEQLACSIDGTGHVGFLTGLSVAGLSDPTDPRTIKYLRGCAADLKRYRQLNESGKVHGVSGGHVDCP